jgi:hypothetical protein
MDLESIDSLELIDSPRTHKQKKKNEAKQHRSRIRKQQKVHREKSAFDLTPREETSNDNFERREKGIKNAKILRAQV